MKTYIMALDQGTTSCRCILYDRQGRTVSVAQKEFRQSVPAARVGGARCHGNLVHTDGGWLKKRF